MASTPSQSYAHAITPPPPPPSLCRQDVFAKGELPTYVLDILTSKYDSVELQDRINVFNQKVLELVVYHVKRTTEPLAPEVRQHLTRLFLVDPDCNFYFESYGGIRNEHPLAATTNGWAARLPAGGASRYYVSNVNHFHKLGGFDAVLQRLQHANAVAQAAFLASGGSSGSAGAAGGARAASGGDASLTPTPTTSSTGAGAAAGGDGGAKPAADDPLAEATVLASCIYIPRLCYTADWARTYYQPIRDALLQRVLLLTDAQLKKAGRDALDGVKNAMLRLGNELCRGHVDATADILAGPEGVCKDDTNIQCAFERWSLALALRILRTDSLSLRVKGVGDIRDMVEAVDGSAAARARSTAAAAWRTNIYAYNQPAAPVAHWFNADKMLQWLVDNRVVDLVLGLRVDSGPLCPVHGQTLSRLPPILDFLCKQAATTARLASAGDTVAEARARTLVGATPEQLDALFRIMEEDDDEVVRKAVYDSIAAIVRNAPIALIDDLHRRLAAVPTTAFDEGFVGLLKSFTEQALIRVAQAGRAGAGDASEGKEAAAPAPLRGAAAAAALSWDDAHSWFGMRQLWDMVSATSAGPLATAASAALVDLLKSWEQYPQLSFVLSACLGKLATAAVPTYPFVKLADALVKALPIYEASLPAEQYAEGTIQRMNAAHPLVKLLADDLRRYKEAAAAEARKRGAIGEGVQTAGALAGETALVGGVGHVEHINARLGLLQ